MMRGYPPPDARTHENHTAEIRTLHPLDIADAHRPGAAVKDWDTLVSGLAVLSSIKITG